MLDGRVIGRATADLLRLDLRERNYGSGRHGFEMAFDAPVVGNTSPIVRVLGADKTTQLSGAYELFQRDIPEIVAQPSTLGALKGAVAANAEGYVENISRRDARGWVWSPSCPEMTVQVEAVLHGRVIGRAAADQMRTDLLERNYGTGRYGFELFFEVMVPGVTAPTLRVMCGDAPADLPGNYELPPLEAHSSPEGYVESVTPLGASGWAWYPSYPNAAVHVQAVLHGRVIGRAAADQMRPDLKERNYGSGLHGFVMSFDERLTGEFIPTLQVTTSEGITDLPGAYELRSPEMPKPFSQELTAPEDRAVTTTAPSASLPEGYVESISRQGARGWVWSPSFPESVAQVEAVLDSRVIGRTSADRLRPDLLERNIGTGRYGFAMSFDEPVTGDEIPDFRVFIPSPYFLPGVGTLPALTPEDHGPQVRGSIATWHQQHAQFTSRGPLYEEFDNSILSNLRTAADVPRALLLAFYLPQYHAIPENDQFWGKGFTEWRQIARGASRFPGHYQPRIPRDLGFYDLNSFSTLRAQAALAKGAGIHAFAYYYYWFNGKRVLEKPLNMLLDSDLDMPFMILWANENWTRTWDGSESEVLLRQDYRQEDEDDLLRDLSRHFLDERYVRVGGRPLFCIYNPDNIPEPIATINRWRYILRSRYSIEPLIFMAQTFGARDPREYGCDGALEFPPHKTAEKLVGRLTPDAYTPGYASQIIAYDNFVDASLSEEPPEYPLIKTAVPSWDNESRRPNRSLTLEGLSPAKYQAWLRTLITRAFDHTILGTPIVAINAWNEWAEAAYLEPDVYFGASYLNATARAYTLAVNDRAAARIARV